MTYEVKRATPTEPTKPTGQVNWPYWFGPGYTEEQEAAIDADETGEATGWYPIDEDCSSCSHLAD